MEFQLFWHVQVAATTAACAPRGRGSSSSLPVSFSAPALRRVRRKNFGLCGNHKADTCSTCMHQTVLELDFK